MTSPRDDYLGRRTLRDRAIARAEVTFEIRAVEFLSRIFHFTRQELGAVYDEAQRISSRRVLSFAALRGAYPTFPAFLASRALYKLHEDVAMTTPRLFKDFRGAPPYRAYAELVELVGPSTVGNQPIALVFPRKGVRGGLVIHDFQELRLRGLVWTYHGDGTDRHSLYVQPYQTFLEGIHRGGHGWRPER